MTESIRLHVPRVHPARIGGFMGPRGTHSTAFQIAQSSLARQTRIWSGDSDQTGGKTDLCDLVDHLGLKFASFQQGLAHDREKQEIVHSVRGAGGEVDMIGPAHRPLRSRHMVDDLWQTAIIDGTDLLAPL